MKKLPFQIGLPRLDLSEIICLNIMCDGYSRASLCFFYFAQWPHMCCIPTLFRFEFFGIQHCANFGKTFHGNLFYCSSGLLLENEKLIISDLDEKFPRHAKHWLPIVWAASIVTRARKEGRIRDDFAVKTIIDELNKFRGMCGSLLNYDWLSVPLVYTQVSRCKP